MRPEPAADALRRSWRPLREGLVRPLLSVLWPGPCLVCDGSLPGAAADGVCPACWAGLRPPGAAACPICSLPREVYTDLEGQPGRPCAGCATGRGFARLIAAVPYDGVAVALHRQLKFHGREELARPMGRRMAGAARLAAVMADLVVPVPPDPRRRRPGTAALLARRVARELDRSIDARALVKTRSSTRQTERPFRERRTALRGLIRARRPAAVAGQRVLLVDDVATTLATIEAAATALTAAGATGVTALVLARTPLHGTRSGESESEVSRDSADASRSSGWTGWSRRRRTR